MFDMTRSPFCTPLKLGMIAAIQSLLLVTPPGASAASADARAPDAVSFIRQAFDHDFVNHGNAVPGSSGQQRRFHEAVLNLIDVRNAAYYTLGDFAAQASQGDVDAFIRAFREYTAACYEEQLGGEADISLKVTGLRSSGTGDLLVSATLARPHAQAKAMTFRVRNPSSGKPAVVDVRVDGIWMSTLKRADFSSFLHRNGGSVTKLTDQLNKIAENIRTSRQG
jgi:phospholipid transport system substrate-binding protein